MLHPWEGASYPVPIYECIYTRVFILILKTIHSLYKYHSISSMSNLEHIPNSVSTEELISFFNRTLRMDKSTIMAERRRLIKLVNGDVFFPFQKWRVEEKNMFMTRPLDRVKLLKVMLFLLGNGCPPWIASQWCITSFWYADDRTRCSRKIATIQDILTRVWTKRSDYFYYDIEQNLYLHMDGNYRESYQVNSHT